MAASSGSYKRMPVASSSSARFPSGHARTRSVPTRPAIIRKHAQPVSNTDKTNLSDWSHCVLSERPLQLQQRLQVLPQDLILLVLRERLQALDPAAGSGFPGHEGPVAANDHAVG